MCDSRSCCQTVPRPLVPFCTILECPTSLYYTNKNDRYGGLWPWNSYRKSDTPNAEGNWTKWPRGAVCSMCRNVFGAIGYDGKYEKMAKYKIIMAKPSGAEIHANFLRSLKVWLERHNEGGGRRLKNIKQLTDVHRQLTVSQEGISGFKNRRRFLWRRSTGTKKKMESLMRAKLWN